MTIKDSQIYELIVYIIGDRPDGYTNATITSTFRDLGEPQIIEAPSADQIVDLADFDG